MKTLITLDPSNAVTPHQLKTTETQRHHTELITHANSTVLTGRGEINGTPLIAHIQCLIKMHARAAGDGRCGRG